MTRVCEFVCMTFNWKTTRPILKHFKWAYLRYISLNFDKGRYFFAFQKCPKAKPEYKNFSFQVKDILAKSI